MACRRLIIAELQEDTQLNTSSLDWLVSSIRWLWLFLAAIFVFIQYALSGTTPHLSRLLILILIGFILNGIYSGFLWAKFFPNKLAVTAIILDAVLAIALLVMLNEHAQLLMPLMLFPVLLAGVRFNAEAGLLIAVPIILSYGVSLIPVLQGGDINRTDLINALLSLGSNVLILFVVGALPGAFPITLWASPVDIRPAGR